jgi:hypothetical protein
MRRIYFILGILLVGTVAMAYLYFSNLNTDRDANDSSLNAATKDAGIVFSFDNDKSFYEILSGQNLLQQVLGETKAKQLKNLREYFINQHSIFNEIDGQKTYIGFSGDTPEINFIMSTQLKEAVNLKLTMNHLGAKKIKLTSKAGIYQVVFPDSSQVYIGAKDKLVIVSNSRQRILPLLNEKMAANSFATFIKANSRPNKNTLGNLYVNYNAVPSLLKEVLSNKLSGELSILNNQDSFAALSYSYSTEKLLFNGITTINNNDNYLKLFVNIPAQKLIIDRILPKKTANYTIYVLGDYLSWQQNLNNWFVLKKEDQNVKKHLEMINQKYRVDLQQIIPKYFKNQLITFQLQSGEKFGAISLTNGDKTNQLLLDLSAEYATGIRIFKESYIPYLFFGEPFRKFDRPFYAIIDNYLIIANNASSIGSFLNSYNTNELLINEQHYLRFSEQLSSSTTITFYMNHQNSYDILGKNLKAPYYRHHLAEDGFRSFSSFSYQLTSDKGKFLSNLLLYKDLKKDTQTDTIPTIP